MKEGNAKCCIIIAALFLGQGLLLWFCSPQLRLGHLLSLRNQNSQLSGQLLWAVTWILDSQAKNWIESELRHQKNGDDGGCRTHLHAGAFKTYNVYKALYKNKLLSKCTWSSVIAS